MNAYAADFRKCLADLDISGIRKLWHHVNPNLPQPVDDAQALISLHIARTQAETMTLRQRAYSHAWLTERGLPSMLPDRLKAKAERLYPKTVNAVGISINFSIKELKPAGLLIQKAMSDVVENMYADNIQDPVRVRTAMFEEGRKERKKLFGNLKPGG